jgi:hypothetical protein
LLLQAEAYPETSYLHSFKSCYQENGKSGNKLSFAQ